MPTFLDAIKLRLGAFSAIFQTSTMSADVTMLTPIKSGTILVDADWAAPGPIGGATPAFVASSRFSADGQAGTARQYRFLSGGSSRWSLYAHSDLESGSNAGSSLICSYYSDAGAYLSDLFSASRVTGGITFPNLATFGNGFSAAGAVTFTGAIASKNIVSTGTRIGLAPTSAPPGGGFRYDYTAGASVAFTSVGPSSNLQFSHGVAGVAASSIFNSGGSLALQWDASAATVQGNVLIGTGTNNAVDRLQVAGSGNFTGGLTVAGASALSYAKVSGVGGSFSGAIETQPNAYAQAHLVFLDPANPVANPALRLIQTGLRAYQMAIGSSGLSTFTFTNLGGGGFTTNFQSNQNAVSLPITLANVNAAIGYGTQFNFQLGDGTTLYNSGGIAYRQETAFTSVPSTQNAIVSLSSLTAGNATEKLRIVSAGRFLLGTVIDDGSNLMQVAGSAAFTGALKIADTTASVGPTTGAIVVSGGAGIAGAINNPGMQITIAGEHQSNGVGTGSVAGSARGVGSVDLQVNRTVANQVASGTYSALLGGQGNSVGGAYSVSSGGANNATAGSYAVSSGGQFNLATGNYSSVGGGIYNLAQIGYSTVAGGYSNYAQASFAAIAGGNFAAAKRYSQFAHSSGRFTAIGDAQYSLMVARAQTTNATATELFLDGSAAAQRITIDNNASLAYQICISAHSVTDRSKQATFWRRGKIYQLLTAASTAIVAGEIQENQVGALPWTATVSADITNGSLKISVVGDASNTINWAATVQAVEITG